MKAYTFADISKARRSGKRVRFFNDPFPCTIIGATKTDICVTDCLNELVSRPYSDIYKFVN